MEEPVGGTIEFEASTRLIPPGGGDGCMRGNSGYRAEELERGLVRLHNAKGRKPAAGTSPTTVASTC